MTNQVNDEMKHPLILNSKFNVWMVQMPDNATRAAMTNFLNNVELGYHTNSFVFSFNGDDTIRIYDTYKIRHTAKATLKSFGSWNHGHGLRVTERDIWSRRASLEGFHFRVVSAYSPPAVTYIEDNCTSERCFKGMYADIWHSLSKKMNFTYTIRRAYAWGSNNNGTWNGTVGMVAKEASDIACTDLAITKDRSTVIDFLSCLQESDELLYLKNPVDSFSTNAYIGSLSLHSWLATITWIIVVPLLLSGILYNGKFDHRNEIHLTKCYQFVIELSLIHI